MITIVVNDKSNTLLLTGSVDTISIDLVKRKLSNVDAPIENEYKRALNNKEIIALIDFLITNTKNELQKPNEKIK